MHWASQTRAIDMAQFIRSLHCTGTVYVYNGVEPKRSEGRKRSSAEDKPKDLPKLCRYQDRCRGGCSYKHLTPEELNGSSRPYRLCWAYPNCHKPNCKFVHWRPTAEETEGTKRRRKEETVDEDNGEKEAQNESGPQTENVAGGSSLEE